MIKDKPKMVYGRSKVLEINIRLSKIGVVYKVTGLIKGFIDYRGE